MAAPQPIASKHRMLPLSLPAMSTAPFNTILADPNASWRSTPVGPCAIARTVRASVLPQGRRRRLAIGQACHFGVFEVKFKLELLGRTGRPPARPCGGCGDGNNCQRTLHQSADRVAPQASIASSMRRKNKNTPPIFLIRLQKYQGNCARPNRKPRNPRHERRPPSPGKTLFKAHPERLRMKPLP